MIIEKYRFRKSAADGAATVWPVLAMCEGRRFVGLAYLSVKPALLVLPFSFVTHAQSWLKHSHVCPLLGKQKKSKTAQEFKQTAYSTT